MRKLYAVILATSIATATPASERRLNEANFPETVRSGQTSLSLRQAGVLSYFFVDVYSAALFTPADVSINELDLAEDTFRLELYYHRDIDRDDALELAWKTLRRQLSETQLERVAPGINALHQRVTDIREGDRDSLTLRTGQALRLERNGNLVFSSDDPELATVYAQLWLGKDGISRRLRKKLLADR